MVSDGRGRPRLEPTRRPGRTAREEILDAAAELFTHQGYVNTSTRQIADAVGVRQASLYHHLATKDDMLDALLAGTIDGALRLAGEQLAATGAPAQRLHTLVVGDARALCQSTWNLAALYLLPELRVARFAEFRAHRAELRARYGRLAQAVVLDCGGPADAADLPFRLVESVINQRSDDADANGDEGVPSPTLPWRVAGGALRTVGFYGDMSALETATASALDLPIDEIPSVPCPTSKH